MNLEINLLGLTRKYHLITKKSRKIILDLDVGWIQNQWLNQLIQMFPNIKIWVQEICPFHQFMVPKPHQMKQVWNHTNSVANFPYRPKITWHHWKMNKNWIFYPSGQRSMKIVAPPASLTSDMNDRKMSAHDCEIQIVSIIYFFVTWYRNCTCTQIVLLQLKLLM